MIKSPSVIVALLTGLNLLNYLDRQLVSAIAPKIQAELRLDDDQLGYIGSAFLIGYLLTSPIFGRLGDRMARKILITIGVAVWCGATAGSGLTSTLAGLIAMRVFVGVGEASYASLSPTIIDDITPPEKKGRTLAIFYAAIPIGSALGYVLGGILEQRFGWRHAFFLAGGPGILLALTCLMIAEPARSQKEGHDAGASVKEALLALGKSERYLWATVGFVAQTFALGGFAFWAPSFLVRKFHMDGGDANLYLGAILVATGFIGTFVGGAWADKRPGKDRTQAGLWVCAVTTTVAVPFAFWSVYAGSPLSFYIALGVAELGIFASTSPINGAFLGTVPGSVRATAMAFSIFVGHLFGDLISVPLVGKLSTFTGDLSGGMILLPIAMALNAVAWWIGTRRAPHPEIVEQIEAEHAAALAAAPSS
jgi:MFS family permease